MTDGDLKDRALMIANNPKAFRKNYLPLDGFISAFSKKAQNSYILPLNANLGLSHSETLDLFRQISDRFPLLVAMGGDDVTPEFYNEPHLHAQYVNPTRDRFELSLLKYYMAKEKGFLLAICRGSQLAAVALGYKLSQDIPLLTGSDVPHRNGSHRIDLKPTTHGHLRSLLGSARSYTVNSFHHQYVLFREGGPLDLAAVGPDGIPEITELKNGRGLFFQSHVELPGNEIGERVLLGVVQRKNGLLAQPPRCSAVF